MVRKFMRQLRLAMMDMVIIILIMMQPNEVNSISFHHSLLRILHHSPYELDNMGGMVFGCLSEIELCEENHMCRRIS